MSGVAAQAWSAEPDATRALGDAGYDVVAMAARVFETNRHGCIRDVLIDSAGIAAGAWVLRVASRRISAALARPTLLPTH